ncbi:MAG: arginine decarboxylase, pyruvoyl-dependent [Methanobacteriaceae archaeon]|jgi:arginine decarboxylase|nr:arginine decarboxylase, pyruvoyl-dependent [Methanobacteriaceae archaeon]OPY23296.1 MAG: Pyruvoyl-dependent arginine decarboxylase [Methanobacterium sp. PtaU1.Bin097]
MKVSITSGKAEGPSKLNAFDNALLAAGIGDVNLIKVSSIIPTGAEIVELPQFPAGKMVNTVLSYVSSSREGDQLCAVIAVAISDELGCVVEHGGINQDPEKVKGEALDMVNSMMRIRGLEIKDIIIKCQEHRVKNQGAAIAAVVYLE